MKPFLFVFLDGDPSTTQATDKYGKTCLRSEWGCGDCTYVLLSRYDTGRLVKGGTTLVKACGCGGGTEQGRYVHFPDTPRNRAVLSKHGVSFTPCANFAEAFALRRV